MFVKHNFTVKSSTNIRHSERKELFPELIEKNYSSKEQFCKLKVKFPDSSFAIIYVHDKDPLLFQYAGNDASILYPSIYFLWDQTEMYPIIYIHQQTLVFLQKGADLMIPGILLLSDFPIFDANNVVTIAILEEYEASIVAVGLSLVSSSEIKTKKELGQKGKAVEVMHVFGDSLWAFGSKRPFPKINIDPQRLTSQLASENVELVPCELNEKNNSDDAIVSAELKADEKSQSENITEMDLLLWNLFFSALRWHLMGKNNLPIDTGQFYANYLLKNVPPGKKLDIKKTRYKKFNNFLREINSSNDGWVVKIKTVQGNDSIESINFEHPFVQSAELLVPNETSDTIPSNTFVKVQENMLSVTEQVLPFLRMAGYRKGDIIDMETVKNTLTNYADKQKLLRDGGKEIQLDDDTLQMAIKHFLPHTFPLNTILQKLCAAMTKTIVVQKTDNKQLVYRGKLPNIELKIEKRSGNKLVTLVNNLSAFGIEAKDVCKAIRGTGTSITTSVSGCEGPQLMIQGNEVNGVVKILLEFGIPKKFIKGTELGVNEKKKKK